MDEKERTPLYRVENGVAYLTLNRPETLNSFTTDFVHEIEDAIVRADTDDEVRVLLLTGEGRGFTSGGNLQELAAMNLDRKRAIYDVDSTADMVRLLYNVKKPVIAAVNGPAYGAGIALAMACDLLIASEKAQFGFSFTGAPMRNILTSGGTDSGVISAASFFSRARSSPFGGMHVGCAFSVRYASSPSTPFSDFLTSVMIVGARRRRATTSRFVSGLNERLASSAALRYSINGFFSRDRFSSIKNGISASEKVSLTYIP